MSFKIPTVDMRCIYSRSLGSIRDGVLERCRYHTDLGFVMGRSRRLFHTRRWIINWTPARLRQAFGWLMGMM